ncbi:MAG: C cytochrome precursor [Verrucomicrobia bacterium]|nr:C cytochrome precursor [Verrucomicrobiota bacterium]
MKAPPVTMIVEWLFIALLLLGAGFLFIGKWTTPGIRLGGALLAIAALVAGWSWQTRLEKKLASRAQLVAPHVGRPEEYAGSESCRACHPDQYTSWHHSFHRTMTQIASPESVRGDFENVTLTLDGEVYRLERRGDEFWVDMVEPDWTIQQALIAKAKKSGGAVPNDSNPAALPRTRRRLTMVTGSHHMQSYWVEDKHGNRQFNFPFVYLFEQARWVPRRDAFLRNPTGRSLIQIWNVGCIDCHSTAGLPRQNEDAVSYDTRVAELGIACEACHGPAANHVRLNSDPYRRYTTHLQQGGDKSIVNPAKLSSKRSADVCGRCHSIHAPRNGNDWLQHGENFHPGDDLQAKLQVFQHMKPSEQRRGLFWNDDMIRVSGREYNGLIQSPCYQKGELSCLSCHSMHQSSRTNQLAQSMESNAACLQCHEKFSNNLEQHTHHAAGSSGSLCYNCHMPYTSYGLLKALRSHQISSPSVKATLQSERPNACNLCHLDKTLAWTAQNLSAWYKTPPQDLPLEEKTISASVLGALKGDAGQRALIAWHMGWKPALTVSQDSWQAPYLAMLLADPYPAVRCIAGRSLNRLPGFGDFAYDYVAGTGKLIRASEQALEQWQKTAKPIPDAPQLLTKNGRLEDETVETLFKSRNNRVVELQE